MEEVLTNINNNNIYQPCNNNHLGKHATVSHTKLLLDFKQMRQVSEPVNKNVGLQQADGDKRMKRVVVNEQTLKLT